jgi:hypothetical protein
MKEIKNVYKILIVKSEGKRPPGRPWRKWEVMFDLDFEDVRLWASYIWLKIESCGRSYEPPGPIKYNLLIRCVTFTFPRGTLFNGVSLQKCNV